MKKDITIGESYFSSPQNQMPASNKKREKGEKKMETIKRFLTF